MRDFKHWLAICGVLATTLVARQGVAAVIDFEDLPLVPNSYQNGSGLAGSFTSGGAVFNNYYDSLYGSWEGWAYSNQTDVTTPGYTNQYSAYNLPSGGGADGSSNFAVAFTGVFNLPDVRIELPAGTRPVSADLTNITYAALIMRDGDPFHFARQFGPGDWFKVIITGLDQSQQPLAVPPVEFYLADYRNIGGAPSYIVDHWTTVSLSSLAGARYLVFSLDSTDSGQYGINTPAYVALDNLVVAQVPEPSTWLLAASGLFAVVVLGRTRRAPARR
jgi:hypothetical protein